MGQERQRDNDLMVDILCNIIEFRNGEGGAHVRHIRVLARLLLEQLVKRTDRYGLTARDIEVIELTAALHDIGKIALSSDILNKPGQLKPEEFSVMRDHAMIGANMLLELGLSMDEPVVKSAYEICRWHHERWDGSGYPDGLAGDDCPISAQVVALADVYDALTTDRIYKKALPHEVAVKLILEGQTGAFNPLLLQCLESIASALPEKLEQVEKQFNQVMGCDETL